MTRMLRDLGDSSSIRLRTIGKRLIVFPLALLLGTRDVAMALIGALITGAVEWLGSQCAFGEMQKSFQFCKQLLLSYVGILV